MIQDKIRNLNGILSNVNFDLFEQLALLGYVWRFSSGIFTLASAGNKLFSSFVAPLGGQTLVEFPNVNKTGNELELYMNEGGTYANIGGVDAVPFCLDRFVSHTNYIGNGQVGTSAAGATLTGGVTTIPCLIPGTGVGISRPGGANVISEIAFMRCKPGTRYTFYLNALGTNTNCCMTADVAFIPD